MNIYKAIWTKIGGRPWSYILRDIWHKYEGLSILFTIGMGAMLGQPLVAVEIVVLLRPEHAGEGLAHDIGRIRADGRRGNRVVEILRLLDSLPEGRVEPRECLP